MGGIIHKNYGDRVNGSYWENSPFPLPHSHLEFLSYVITVYASTALGTEIAKAGSKTRLLKGFTVYAASSVAR